MDPKTASLPQIQRWMQSVLMHSGDLEQALESQATRQHLDVSAETLDQVISRSQALDSASRLEIYIDAYYERLLECLGEEFPATRAAVGEELFGGLAFGYLQRQPSRSYTLNLLGASFPQFLAETRLHEQGAPEGCGPTWGTCVIELAAFERTLRDVFDAPGSEDRALLGRDQLAATPESQWGELRLNIAPPLRLEHYTHPVHQFWAAHKASQEPELPTARESWLAIHRRHYVVERHELELEQFLLLEQLDAGHSVAQAVEIVHLKPGVRRDLLAERIGPWFAEWTLAGFFLN